MVILATHVGDIFVNAKLNDKEYKKGLNNLESSTSKMLGSLGKKMATVFSVAAIAKFAKSAIDAGARFEQAIGGVEVLFGKSAEKMKLYAQQAYKTAGVSANQYMEQAALFSAKLLQDTGGNADKTADIIDRAIVDMSDNFNRFGGDFSMIQRAYQGFLRQNYFMLDNLHLGYQGTRAEMQRLLADAEAITGIHYDEKNLADVINAIHVIQQKLGIAGTTANEALTTWSGAFNMLKASFENFKATFGQGLINLLQPVLRVIARISDALTMLGYKFLAWTRKVMGIKDSLVGRSGQKDLQKAATKIGGVSDNLGGASKNAGKAKKAVQALKRELLGFDQITKLAKQDSSTGTSGNVGTGGSGGGVSVGGLDFGTAEQDATSFQNRINEIFGGIKIPEKLQEALGNLKRSLGDLFDTLEKGGKWVLDNVLEPVGKWLVEDISPSVINLLADAIDILNIVLKALGTALEPVWKLLQPLFKAWGEWQATKLQTLHEILTKIMPYLEKFGEWWGNFQAAKIELVTKAFKGFTEGLQDGAIGTVTEKLGALKEKWDTFKTNLSNSFAEFKINFPNNVKEKLDELKQKWNDFKENVANKAAEFKAKVATKWSDLKDSWNNITSNIKDKTANMKASIGTKWSDLKAKWKSITDNIKDKTATIKMSFSNTLSKAWNSLADKVNAARKSNKVIKNLLPAMPKLAQGGWVDKNTPQLAMIGDNRHHPEIVAPDDKLAAMARQAAHEARGGADAQTLMTLQAILQAIQNLNLNVELDGEKIKNNTVSRINRHTISTGQLELVI